MSGWMGGARENPARRAAETGARLGVRPVRGSSAWLLAAPHTTRIPPGTVTGVDVRWPHAAGHVTGRVPQPGARARAAGPLSAGLVRPPPFGTSPWRPVRAGRTLLPSDRQADGGRAHARIFRACSASESFGGATPPVEALDPPLGHGARGSTPIADRSARRAGHRRPRVEPWTPPARDATNAAEFRLPGGPLRV